MRGECVSVLPKHVFCSSVVVAKGIFDLVIDICQHCSQPAEGLQPRTYVHVHDLAIALGPPNRRCDDDQSVTSDEIPYASLFALGFTPWMRLEIELEGVGKGQEQ